MDRSGQVKFPIPIFSKSEKAQKYTFPIRTRSSNEDRVMPGRVIARDDPRPNPTDDSATAHGTRRSNTAGPSRYASRA